MREADAPSTGGGCFPERAQSESRGPVGPRPSGHLWVTGRETDRLDGGDVIRLHAPTPLGRLVGDLGALLKALEAVACYTRVVHKEIITALVGGDEAVALLVVEPLYCSLGH